jgi:hypothetical protein
MSYDSLLIDTCTIQRFTEGAVDNYGNKAKTWPDHLTDEPCRLTTPTGREIKIGAEVVIADFKVFLGDIDITEQDRIEIDSVTYEVLLVADRQNGLESHHKECYVRAIR